MSFLTIFTPTYNRADLLVNLYNSLELQENKSFEWIIVDDDSSDNTLDVVKSFNTKDFNINYFKVQHGGKHRAINYAVSKAKGDWFFIVDSDDTLTNNAVNEIYNMILSVESSHNNQLFCGVAGLKVHSNGDIVGESTPLFNCYDFIDATNLERKNFNLESDKAEVYKTDILKKFPFPEFPGEFFLTEAVVWDLIASYGYKIRWFNVPIYICEYLLDGLTLSGANSRIGCLKNPKGFALYVKQNLRFKEKNEKIISFLTYISICSELKIKLKERLIQLDINYFMYIKLTISSFLFRLKRKINTILGKI